MRRSAAHRHELARFLRTRRARLTPAAVGLPPGGARRTPGLRREEVAVLAGVGVTWYTWLEQGREINPSDEVLASIARTLRLSDAETAHLFALARPAPAADHEPVAPAALRALVDSQDPAVAVLSDARFDVVAWNRSAEALFGYGSFPPDERNTVWLMFANPAMREILPDWAADARRLIAEVRGGSPAVLADPRFAALLDRLRREFPEARRWWDTHEVLQRGGLTKRFRHPVAGELLFERVVLRPVGAPELELKVLLPAEGTGTGERLIRLADSRSGKLRG
jgi:PAS domain-containing protein